jgi:uncharacterized membrane protein YqhA
MYRALPYALKPTVELHRVTVTLPVYLSLVLVLLVLHMALKCFVNIPETVRHAKYLYSYMIIAAASVV